MKGIKDAIQAITDTNKNASKKWTLNIIGRGEENYEKELKNLVSKGKMNEYIRFLGYVDEKMKFEEMARSWVLLVPSSREGWGMIVPEANSVGTPAIGYNVAGLCDVLARYSSENIVITQSISNLSDVIRLIKNPILVTKKVRSGWEDLYKYLDNSI
jgi:glycosyltransferase involved in cell wall biosynthesis